MARNTVNRSTGRTGKPPWMVIASLLLAFLKFLPAIIKLFSKSRAIGAPPTSAPRTTPPPPTTTAPRSNQPGRGVVRPSIAVGGDGGIPDLFRRRQSDTIVQAEGLIVKVLPDDEDTSDGSEQHQKFLVELAVVERLTIKICHNLKFGRAPAREGQSVRFRGEYEYSDKGGSVHWTHHDPKQWHEDGWVEIDGQRYG